MKGQRVFTAGHSFHVWIVSILDEIAKSAGINDHRALGESSIGGSSVMQHWTVPDLENKAKASLIVGEVDVLTLSPIWVPDGGIEKFAMLGLQHNWDIRITVQEFWLPNDIYNPVYPLDTGKCVDHNATPIVELKRWHFLYFRDMDHYISDLNAKLGKDVLFIVPVGQAVLALREKILSGVVPGLKTQAELFTDSWGHPTEPIQVLATYCHFILIYHCSPIGLPVPKVLMNGKIPPEDISAVNLLLQELAWDAVIQHPLSGVLPPHST